MHTPLSSAERHSAISSLPVEEIAGEFLNKEPLFFSGGTVHLVPNLAELALGGSDVPPKLVALSKQKDKCTLFWGKNGMSCVCDNVPVNINHVLTTPSSAQEGVAPPVGEMKSLKNPAIGEVVETDADYKVEDGTAEIDDSTVNGVAAKGDVVEDARVGVVDINAQEGAFQRNSLVATLAALGMILGAAYSLWLYNRAVSGNFKPDFLHKFSDPNGREVSQYCILRHKHHLGFFHSSTMQCLTSTMVVVPS
ncbi:NADH-ubiquinone oxidoreductase chain 4 [Platanthera guangdongensis]|uniref:NADH-ubiquinone oxidoreductase chain 4 n=1 Tax=Platanthera guangdongensis TaxID=2320717 RepID=A0ABR2LDJ3_9ASPA